MHAYICVCVFEPRPCPERGPMVPSLSLMRLDELALRDMIWTAVAPPPLPPPPYPPSLLFVLLPSSSPALFFSWSSDRHLVAKKMPGATPRLSAFIRTAAALYHAHTHKRTHLDIKQHTMKHFRLPTASFPLTHAHADSLALPCGSSYTWCYYSFQPERY